MRKIILMMSASLDGFIEGPRNSDITTIGERPCR
jgi:hypothetical protein